MLLRGSPLTCAHPLPSHRPDTKPITRPAVLCQGTHSRLDAVLPAVVTLWVTGGSVKSDAQHSPDRQHRGVPDLLWDEVKNFFNPALMGALPDVEVLDTSTQDWQKVFDLVQSSGWTWEYLVGDVVTPLPPAAEVLARSPGDEVLTLRVCPAADVLVIFRPWSADWIDFDVDLRELQGQRGVDLLCDFLGAIGRTLGKRVLMSAEGDLGHPVLGFDPAADRVVLLADPRL